MYGYYGRTASPPPSALGTWGATPGPQHTVGGDVQLEEAVLASGALGSVVADGASGVVESKEGEKLKAGGDEDFVADFIVPEGVVIPASVRQHIMMVGTARTAVRSPQVRAEKPVSIAAVRFSARVLWWWCFFVCCCSLVVVFFCCIPRGTMVAIGFWGGDGPVVLAYVQGLYDGPITYVGHTPAACLLIRFGVVVIRGSGLGRLACDSCGGRCMKYEAP